MVAGGQRPRGVKVVSGVALEDEAEEQGEGGGNGDQGRKLLRMEKSSN